MIRGILIGVLAVAVGGTAFWGYQEHQEKNAILINAENNYQRAFHDLTYQVDLLHDKIGATLAMNTQKSLSPALADVWRITSEAHNDVGQLPLTLLPFNKTEEFLAQVGEFSHRTAVRNLEKDPLTSEEQETLQSLYEQAATMQEELRTVQNMVIQDNLRWMDVEMALASGEETTDNTIIDGFKTVEKTVDGYDETGFGPNQVSSREKEIGYKDLDGDFINKEEARKIAEKYIPVPKNAKMTIAKGGPNKENGFYSVTYKKGNWEATMDITRKGGYPIYLLQNRDITDQNISLNEASKEAEKFLKEHNFMDMELFESTQYDNVGLFTFVSISEDGVRIYPDAISIKVALDDGSILNFTAEEYLKSHKTRDIPEPTISKEEAKSMLNSNVKVQDDRLSIIVNELGEEVLSYEFLATLNNDTYRIFINANNGVEEEIEKLQNAEPIYENLV
ncbi:germination protein YpeB [Bacillus fonticola]|uniref:germination protein YpeB n=1 Tax=Bacillus fonticola TaxID=2728853 RepID=UPI00147472DD|nr:germination protein YpeB [Bacillus fonticola]